MPNDVWSRVVSLVSGASEAEVVVTGSVVWLSWWCGAAVGGARGRSPFAILFCFGEFPSANAAGCC